MAKHKLDNIDREILEALQSNACLSNMELADKICLSPSPCSRRVKILEEEGYIRSRVSLLDPDKIGLSVSVFIQVTLNHQAKKNLLKFEKAVAEWPEVMECYLMTGDFDYLMRVVVPDLNVYQQFLDIRLTPLQGIDNIRSSFSLKRVRYKTNMPLNHIDCR
ncbi:MAG: Lrp/AsnC family transcriptional regulator [Pseudomonadales bacterium]|nr:Lrp/AsnC family transcriptional regulator [Pseudomonadales bacterium]